MVEAQTDLKESPFPPLTIIAVPVALKDFLTLSGMQGYDVPMLADTGETVATFTLLQQSPSVVRFKLKGNLPVCEDSGTAIHSYHVKVDREYTATVKQPGVERKRV